RRSLLQLPDGLPRVVEDLAEDPRIGGRRVARRTLPREEHERYAAPDHALTELLREIPRRAQPVRLDVFGRHGLRDIHREDDVHTEAARTSQTQVDERASERD